MKNKEMVMAQELEILKQLRAGVVEKRDELNEQIEEAQSTGILGLINKIFG